MSTVIPNPPAVRGAADAPGRLPARSLRKTAAVAGGLYLLTFVTSIPTLPLFASLQEPAYVLGPGPDTGALWGVLLNVICALAGVGTAITLFPVVKRQNESLAIGF